ncbi:hypothetical protein [Bradyrhizobium liaoningense]|uniref:hypothetical protein n=1 Tax=Bradyrhizobium liaoningense TaxID=43992 RepID=UPI001BAB917C|nr:hypothetical protein [Bradyrhizobium liaoningense]MBR0719571.1 hypothetical protein [Bradyrhizobium liaoningense]
MLALQQRQNALSVLLTLPLVRAQYLQFGFGAAGFSMLPFQVNDQRLMLRQPPLSFDCIPLELSQLIKERIVEHKPTARHHPARSQKETAPAQP